jgi:hypothetical protein
MRDYILSLVHKDIRLVEPRSPMWCCLELSSLQGATVDGGGNGDGGVSATGLLGG